MTLIAQEVKTHIQLFFYWLCMIIVLYNALNLEQTQNSGSEFDGGFQQAFEGLLGGLKAL
jgi:hypothetical protein